MRVYVFPPGHLGPQRFNGERFVTAGVMDQLLAPRDEHAKGCAMVIARPVAEIFHHADGISGDAVRPDRFLQADENVWRKGMHGHQRP